MTKSSTTPMTQLNTEKQPAPKETDCKKFFQTLQLVIDGEAAPEEKEYFDKHIHSCIDCADFYEVERAIHDAIKLKIEKKPVPSGLMDNIKSKIKGIEV